jgi:hypothetical protein
MSSMTISYTNRKGKTYHLCRGTTKTGKPRYYFAREPKGEPVQEIPEGYEIRESVNGIVSLAKARPKQILPDEVAVVEAALRQHPKPGNYRVDVKAKQIVIYERVGADMDDLSRIFQAIGGISRTRQAALQEVVDQHAQFSPVLRFTLSNEEKRTFYAERWCYLGSIDDWIHAGPNGPVHLLAQLMIPRLGTDAFFDLY